MPRFPKGSQEAKDYMASIRAKKGGSCSGGSAVGGNPSVPSGPPPPPPPPPPRPSLTPINTSINPDQSLINGLEELLASTTLPQARRAELTAYLNRLKERVSGNPQSGAGISLKITEKKKKMSGKGANKSKIAPMDDAEVQAPPERPPVAVVLQPGEGEDIPDFPEDLNFQEVTEREEPQQAQSIDERYLFYKPINDEKIRDAEERVAKLYSDISYIRWQIGFNNRHNRLNTNDSDFVEMKLRLIDDKKEEIAKLEEDIKDYEDQALLLIPENRYNGIFGFTPTMFDRYREQYFPIEPVRQSLLKKPSMIEKAKKAFMKPEPTIANIEGMFIPKEGEDFNPANFGRREMERIEEERRREAERRREDDEDATGSGMRGMGGKSSKIAPSPDPLTDPEYLALIAESDRVMKQMKERVEKLKKISKKKGEGLSSSKIAPAPAPARSSIDAETQAILDDIARLEAQNQAIKERNALIAQQNILRQKANSELLKKFQNVSNDAVYQENRRLSAMEELFDPQGKKKRLLKKQQDEAKAKAKANTGSSAVDSLMKAIEDKKKKGGGDDGAVGGSGINGSYVVQSVIFKKDMFSVSKAKKWLKEHNHKAVKVDKTKDMLRFRQIEPVEVEKMGFTEYRTKPLGDSGVELVLVYKPTKMKVLRLEE